MHLSDTLSQLIRTAFVPAPGQLFYIADFSAIEARVLSWLAGEQWRKTSETVLYCLNGFRTRFVR